MSDAPAYYLAGPMTGYPKFNIPTFRSAADLLRKLGMEIISPVELDSERVYLAAMRSKDGKLDKDGKLGGETWGDMLSRDVKVISDKAAGVIVLPGWKRSKGARLEVFVSLLCNKPVYAYVGDKFPDLPIVAIPAHTAMGMIHDGTVETVA